MGLRAALRRLRRRSDELLGLPHDRRRRVRLLCDRRQRARCRRLLLLRGTGPSARSSSDRRRRRHRWGHQARSRQPRHRDERVPGDHRVRSLHLRSDAPADCRRIVQRAFHPVVPDRRVLHRSGVRWARTRVPGTPPPRLAPGLTEPARAASGNVCPVYEATPIRRSGSLPSARSECAALVEAEVDAIARPVSGMLVRAWTGTAEEQPMRAPRPRSRGRTPPTRSQRRCEPIVDR